MLGSDNTERETAMDSNMVNCECGGVLSGVVADYQMELSDGHVINIPSTPFAKCNKCGECELQGQREGARSHSGPGLAFVADRRRVRAPNCPCMVACA